MSARTRLLGISAWLILAATLGVFAAWPIYQTWWLVVPATVGTAVGVLIGAFVARRFGLAIACATLFGAFVLTVVPVAVPSSFERLPSGLLRGLLDGVAAIVLGWKQLLTLTLPVGTYQAIMVPAYLVFLVVAFVATLIAVRAKRFAALAAFPLVAPVAFGTIFGSSAVSAPLAMGPLRVTAPRELALWLFAATLGACWVWFAAGAERRAALRRGRVQGERSGGSRALRGVLGAATVLVALAAGLVLAPVLDGSSRQVPRDRIDPEIVLRERTSPLASYRTWKRDSSLDAPMFTLSSEGAMPGRLRLAVLDAYDGVDFHVSADEAGRFTRYPSGANVSDPATVTIRVDDGYSDIWVPTAGLGSVPRFGGKNADDLADAFFVNRATEAAIAVPGGTATNGLEAGDTLTATMSTEPDAQLSGGPIASASTIDLETMPELASWLKAQNQPATAEGLLELIKRLRDRGYLSHSISAGEGEQLWLQRLTEKYGTKFESSAGGHSLARLELLFSQLNTQQRLAGEEATPEMLVAAVGDDEQFAAAAALIAQALGFDSRVVMGVRAGDDAAEVPGIPACDTECKGENVAAWVEVQGDQGEWVPIDVTPQVKLRPTTLEEGEQLPEFPTTPEERDAKEVDPPLGLGERNDSLDDPSDDDKVSWLLPVLRAVGLSLSALLLLILPLVFLPLAKRRRARARRAEPSPELRALGAWQELVEGAADAGAAIPVGASRSQIAEALGTAPARWAADTATRAVFSAQGVSAQDADWMWEAVEADRAARGAALTPWQRFRARYSLKSYGVKIMKWRSGAAESAEMLSGSRSAQANRKSKELGDV